MRAATAAVLLIVLGAAPRAARAIAGYDGTRPLAMGDAGRAWATGDSGPFLNPSGMALAKSYNVEGSYAYGSALAGTNILHASVVDSTSEINLAGGLSYTYVSDALDGVHGTTHEGIASLALPVGDVATIGGSLRYVYATGSAAVPSRGGFTFDVGTTIKPAEGVTLALVGVNLANVAQDGGRALAYAGAYGPTASLLLVLDGETQIGSHVIGHGRTSGLGGLEWTVSDRVVLRAGGGYNGPLGTWRGAAGGALLSRVGAIDVGVQGDLTTSDVQPTRAYVLGVSVRLFVASMVSAAQ
jgi:hypothetical protein